MRYILPCAISCSALPRRLGRQRSRRAQGPGRAQLHHVCPSVHGRFGLPGFSGISRTFRDRSRGIDVCMCRPCRESFLCRRVPGARPPPFSGIRLSSRLPLPRWRYFRAAGAAPQAVPGAHRGAAPRSSSATTCGPSWRGRGRADDRARPRSKMGGFSVQIESPYHEFFGELDRPAQFRPEQPLRRGGDFHLSRLASNRSRVGWSSFVHLDQPRNRVGRVHRCSERLGVI